MTPKTTIQPYGEKALLIQWEAKIDKSISNEVLQIKTYLQEIYSPKLADVVNGYASLLLLFTANITKHLIEEITFLLKNYTYNSNTKNSKIWKIPVCYAIEFGIDLKMYLQEKKLTLNQFIKIHTQPTYHVYCKGFLPGFMYLGGLNKQLHYPRKKSPELRIPKNSIAIGGKQTGIYPCESPGGWHIIGRTPVDFFDINKPEYSKVKIGDGIQFLSISIEQFKQIKALKDPFTAIKHIEN